MIIKPYRKLVHGGDIYSYGDSVVLDFSANINLLGMPESVKQAIVDNVEFYASYPDPLCRELKQALSVHEHISSNKIVCGNGAADIIFRLVLALHPQKALIFAPTFAEYESALKMVDCSVNYFTLQEENGFIVDKTILEMITDELGILFICNPNNPTGILTKRSLMIEIANKCRETNTVLVVDECFNDFLECAEDYTIVDELDHINTTIVLKAFTKIYAMAGIRLGYALSGNTTLIEQIEGALQPWSVSTVASKCGIAALSEMQFVEKTKVLTKRNREYLAQELTSLGMKVFDSKANYLFFKCGDNSLDIKLKDYNILIRSCENYRGLGAGYFRIAVRSEQDNARLINTIKEIN